MGAIDSPTEKNLRAAATATALSEPTPRALMATAPGGGSAGSADITVFVRVREDKSELVSRTAITVPRGSTPTDVARTAVKSKSNNEEWDRLSVFPATANAFMSSDEPVSRSVDVPMDQELDSLVEANHPFLRITFTKPRTTVVCLCDSLARSHTVYVHRPLCERVLRGRFRTSMLPWLQRRSSFRKLFSMVSLMI